MSQEPMSLPLGLLAACADQGSWLDLFFAPLTLAALARPLRLAVELLQPLELLFHELLLPLAIQ